MSSLRTLDLRRSHVSSILDGCTFKLDSFRSGFAYDESLRNFLNSQPSLTDVTFINAFNDSVPFEDTCLPNLTQAAADPSWLRMLIPGRPVRSVTVFAPPHLDDCELSLFALSTSPIQKLTIPCAFLYPQPGSFLVSLFPSLVHLTLEFYCMGHSWDPPAVRRSPFYLFI
jgi:hypothetical protein